jgi:hypothetical protein
MPRLALPLALLLAAARLTAEAANPVGGSSPADFIGGLADPNLHFFNGTFTLWATHDFSPNDTSSVMKDWWVWSSPDLVAWTEESVVTPACRTECLPSCLPSCPSKPGGVFLFDHSPSLCWATDAAFVNGSYYFYLSAGGSEVGVVTSTSLKGPWRDPLRGVSLMSNVGSVGALLSYAFGGTFSPRAGFRDPCVFHDSSTGEHYLISGVFQYYVMKLAPNMTALAEHPRLLEFTADQPVYGPLGLNQTDDKPFMHKNGDTYYLSWGCFYSTSKSVYGPFTMQGSVISTAKLAPAFRCNGTCGYHGHPSPPPPGPPGPNQCHPSTNQTKNCNVCAECCRDYIPNGAECDKCVKEECKKGVDPSRPLRQPAAKGPAASGWYQGQDYVDRHGSFTQHGKQWYFATNDYSHGTDRFNTGLFRDTVIVGARSRQSPLAAVCTCCSRTCCAARACLAPLSQLSSVMRFARSVTSTTGPTARWSPALSTPLESGSTTPPPVGSRPRISSSSSGEAIKSTWTASASGSGSQV